jgi:uncharacterized protein YggE
VDKKDMKTVNVGSEPKWSDRIYADPKKKIKPKEPAIVGYDAWNSVTIRVRDITRVGDLLSALAHGGATSLSQAWDINDKQSLEDQARVIAIKDAKRKANLYAKEAEITLGSLEELTESQRWSGYGAGRGLQKQAVTMSAVMEDVPMESGEQAITINVSVAYNIS